MNPQPNGSWLDDLDVPAPDRSFEPLALFSFTRDGIVPESDRPVEPHGSSFSGGHGGWQVPGGRTCEISCVTIQYAADSTVIGRVEVQATLTRSQEGASLTGSGLLKLVDPQGAVLVTVPAFYEGARIAP